MLYMLYTEIRGPNRHKRCILICLVQNRDYQNTFNMRVSCKKRLTTIKPEKKPKLFYMHTKNVYTSYLIRHRRCRISGGGTWLRSWRTFEHRTAEWRPTISSTCSRQKTPTGSRTTRDADNVTLKRKSTQCLWGIVSDDMTGSRHGVRNASISPCNVNDVHVTWRRIGVLTGSLANRSRSADDVTSSGQ